MLRQNWVRIFTGLCLLIGLVRIGHGFDRQIGARPQGMGDAYTALAGDMNTLNYNPAGLALGKNIEASMEYANLYPGLSDGLLQENHLVYMQPLAELGGLGLGWNNRSLAGVYHENEVNLGYGRALGSLPFWVGATAKLFYLDYTDEVGLKANDYFNDNAKKFQAGVDAGLLYELPRSRPDDPRIRMGLSVMNLNEPDLGLKAQSREPLECRLGGSLNAGEADGAVDLLWKDSAYEIHAGAEKWWQDEIWGVRTGFITGDHVALAWTAGGSYTLPMETDLKLRIDYAFQYSFGGIQNTYGIHRLAINFIYPLAAPAESMAAVESPKITRIRNYLFEKIDAYLLLSDRIPVFKNQAAPEQQATIAAVEDQMHEAVGELVLHQNILGFLEKLKAARQLSERLEGGKPLAVPEKSLNQPEP